MPANWRDVVAETIERAERDGLAEIGHIIFPGIEAEKGDRAGFSFRMIPVESPVGPMSDEELAELIGCVNLHATAGAQPGHLLIAGSSKIFDESGNQNISMRFVYRDRSWNELLAPDGKWVTLVDAVGATIYELKDFAAIS